MIAIGEERVDFRSADFKKRTEESELTDFLASRHSLDAGGAAEQVEEDCFGLVVSVVGEEDFGDSGVARAFIEEAVTSFAGSCFEGEFFFGSESRNVGLLGEKRRANEVTEKGFISIGFLSTQTVVEVAKDEALKAVAGEPVVKSDRITASGDSHEIGFLGIEPIGKFDRRIW